MRRAITTRALETGFNMRNAKWHLGHACASKSDYGAEISYVHFEDGRPVAGLFDIVCGFLKQINNENTQVKVISVIHFLHLC